MTTEVSAPPESEPPLCSIYQLIMDVALARGVTSISTLPGPWTFTADQVFIAVNGHHNREEVLVPGHKPGTRWIAVTLAPYQAIVSIYGWIVFVGSPFTGVVCMITEEELISRLKSLSTPKQTKEGKA